MCRNVFRKLTKKNVYRSHIFFFHIFSFTQQHLNAPRVLWRHITFTAVGKRITDAAAKFDVGLDPSLFRICIKYKRKCLVVEKHKICGLLLKGKSLTIFLLRSSQKAANLE